MFSHVISRTYRDSAGASIESQETVTDNTELNFDASMPIGTNAEIDWTCTVANLKSIVLWSDKAVDLYTNDVSGGSPQEHIALAAGVAKIWTRAGDGAGTIPFAGNVTKICMTNVAIATLKIRALADQTP